MILYDYLLSEILPFQIQLGNFLQDPKIRNINIMKLDLERLRPVVWFRRRWCEKVSPWNIHAHIDLVLHALSRDTKIFYNRWSSFIWVVANHCLTTNCCFFVGFIMLVFKQHIPWNRLQFYCKKFFNVIALHVAIKNCFEMSCLTWTPFHGSVLYLCKWLKSVFSGRCYLGDMVQLKSLLIVQHPLDWTS